MKHNKTQPLVSLITVVYNCEQYVEEAVKSVLNQTYPNIEYIVVDGASIDLTLEIIDNYRDEIDVLISEPDRGIYDAMNKGLRLSTGEIVGFVNADDSLYPDAIEKVVAAFHDSKNPDYVYGIVDRINKQGKVIGQTKPISEEQMNSKRFQEMPFAHPACFISKHVYNTIGVFDLKFAISADYDFILRMMEHEFIGHPVEIIIARFREGGRSGGLKTFMETLKVHKKHGVTFIDRHLSFVSSVIKLTIMNYFPPAIVKSIRKFRKNSRHTDL
jgi:glycosyltransferase involved in cell wall biosynthesis